VDKNDIMGVHDFDTEDIDGTKNKI